ncbi:tetratricopeptide repeat protein [Dictyocaulus viviparus]|uniref:Cell division cycle protein 27 homolog n=1 Tax=Dictyocaulus viviparus TaxID=29172 RepID=A0A0D8XAI7_DICVI|nr:tetratricopeptide repeat protein [Dictyocaulus viviparus]
MDTIETTGHLGDAEDLIRDFLDHCNLDDAVFLAELNHIRGGCDVLSGFEMGTCPADMLQRRKKTSMRYAVQFDDQNMEDFFRETTDRLFPSPLSTSSRDDMIASFPSTALSRDLRRISNYNANNVENDSHQNASQNSNHDSENAGSRNRATPPRLNRLRQQHSLRAITRINEMGPVVEISRSECSPSSRKQRSDIAAKQHFGSDSGDVQCVSSTAPPITNDTLCTSSSNISSDFCEKEHSLAYKDLFLCVKSFAFVEDAIGSYRWNVAKKILGKGMELLSTALWHLQDTHELSSLAQHLTSEARLRPQTWCVAGNCFSLQRQHARAIECMERAIQLDPYFAYAYTLLGHELIFQEEYDRAAIAFRRALEISPKDYRAWHGLGLVHLRKEQMGLAQVNISKAVTINPTNRAMLCQLAQIEQALNRLERAMRLTDRALALDSDDVACRYNRARLLYETKRNEECVKELNELKEVSPDEAYIYHLLGKVHRRLGNNHLALLNYSWATEMDPRGEQMLGHTGGRPCDDDDPSASAS